MSPERAESAGGGTATGGLSVRGGIAGTTINLAELGELAGALGEVARLLRWASAGLHRAAGQLEPGVALAPSAGARALAALLGAAQAAAALAAAVGRLSADTLRAREQYQEAEGSACSRVAAVLVPRGPLDLMPGSHAITRGLRLPAPFDIGRPEQALRPLGWALSLVSSSDPGITLAVNGPADVPTDVPAGAGDLLAGIAALYPEAGAEPGGLEVRRVEQPNGATSWVVLIPGTQSFSPGGVNPTDVATNLQEFVGAPSAMGLAVVATLAAARIGPDEPVLLAGHSQGGLVATRLAADPAFRRHYRVAGVLTAGSPVGHVRTPAGLAALHLEHATDVVPALDHARNPDTADRVTVARAGTGSALQAHAASAYARTGVLVDASSNPSVLAWHQQMRRVLGGAGATATRTVYSVQRLG